jgi:mannose-6-phosphate isomerase-like protein (cupin superfamily)
VSVALEGGCRVTDMKEGVASVNGTLSAWEQARRADGGGAISLRLMEFWPGLSDAFRNQDCDEIIYVLEGEASIFIDGWPYSIRPESGVYLRPNEVMTVDNPGPLPLVLVSARCPAPPGGPATTSDRRVTPHAPPPIVHLADCKAVPTSNRWYRVLIDNEVGSAQATQFIGSIPPGRAPDHFHTYEEVLFIIQGTGRMWAGETSTAIGPGSCVYLPARQVHCVENLGTGELRLLGVFYPAGSPGVRYDVD